MVQDVRSTLGLLDLDAGNHRFGNLAITNKGRKVLLYEQQGVAPQTGIRPYYVSTHGLTQRPDDPDFPVSGYATQPYPGRMRKGFVLKRSRINGNVLRGRSTPDQATLSLTNVDGWNSFPSSDVKGAGAELFIGSDGWLRAEWQKLFSGICADSVPSNDNRTISVTLQDRQALLKKPIQKNRYLGLSKALDFQAATSGLVTTPHQDSFSGFTRMTLEVYVLDAWTGSIHSDEQWMNHSNFALAIKNVAGVKRLVFTIIDSTGGTHAVQSAITITPGSNGRATGVWDGTTMRIYWKGVADANTTAFSGLGGIGSGNLTFAATGQMTDIRIWNIARNTDQIQSTANGFLSQGDRDGIIFYAKTNEVPGTTGGFDEITQAVLTLSGSVDYADTLTGGEELGGMPIPLTLGRVWHRDAILVDQWGLVYQYHDPTYDGCHLDGVFEGGMKLAPLFSLALTDLSYDSTRKRFTTRTKLSFQSLAQGQPLTITGGSNAGAFTVALVDEEKGLWFTVVEAVTTANDTGTSVTVATTSGQHDYIPNELAGTFALVNKPSREITCRGRHYQLSTRPSPIDWMKYIHSDIAGVSYGNSGVVDSLAKLYPYECGYATTTADEDADLVIDRLASSFGADWGYDTSGSLDVDVLKPPTTVIRRDKLIDLRQGTKILTIQRLRSTPAVKKAAVNYRHNFHPLTFDTLATEVQQDSTTTGQAHLAFITSTSLRTEYDPNITPDPLVIATDELDSYLTTHADAHAVAIANYSLYGTAREVFEVKTGLEPLLYDWRRAEGLVTHDRWESTLNGKYTTIINMEITRTRVTLQVMG